MFAIPVCTVLYRGNPEFYFDCVIVSVIVIVTVIVIVIVTVTVIVVVIVTVSNLSVNCLVHGDILLLRLCSESANSMSWNAVNCCMPTHLHGHVPPAQTDRYQHWCTQQQHQ